MMGARAPPWTPGVRTAKAVGSRCWPLCWRGEVGVGLVLHDRAEGGVGGFELGRGGGDCDFLRLVADLEGYVEAGELEGVDGEVLLFGLLEAFGGDGDGVDARKDGGDGVEAIGRGGAGGGDAGGGGWWRWTTAPGMTAPVWSRTEPWMPASPPVWAMSAPVAKRSRAREEMSQWRRRDLGFEVRGVSGEGSGEAEGYGMTVGLLEMEQVLPVIDRQSTVAGWKNRCQ